MPKKKKQSNDPAKPIVDHCPHCKKDPATCIGRPRRTDGYTVSMCYFYEGPKLTNDED